MTYMWHGNKLCQWYMYHVSIVCGVCAQCAMCGSYGATIDYVVCVVQGEQSVFMRCLLHNLSCVLDSLKG